MADAQETKGKTEDKRCVVQPEAAAVNVNRIGLLNISKSTSRW